MNAFSALLEARDPALGRFRSYRLEAGTDLFGAWLVQVTYGRIGAPGRSVRYVVGVEEEARHLVRKTLRRRSTARNGSGSATASGSWPTPGGGCRYPSSKGLDHLESDVRKLRNRPYSDRGEGGAVDVKLGCAPA